MSSQVYTQFYSSRAGISSFNLEYTVTSTEGLTATCAPAFELS